MVLPKCKKCKKQFTKKTLDKNSGCCGKCTNAKGITKKNIPKILKDKVWETYIGDKLKGSCYICEKEITASNFQAGHIVSEYDGGSITVENLRPTCKSCNVKTGVFNMNDIKNSLKIQQTVAVSHSMFFQPSDNTFKHPLFDTSPLFK